MSWVSYSKLQTLCQALRNKFTTGEIVIANDDKSIGAHLNHTAQDGLVTLSPIVEDGTTPAALWVTDSAANNATELTGGTLSYVTDVGKDTEDYTSISLVGGVVNVSGKSGAQRRITNVAAPMSDYDALNWQHFKDYGPYIAGSSNKEALTVTIPTSEEFTTISTYCPLSVNYNRRIVCFISLEYILTSGARLEIRSKKGEFYRQAWTFEENNSTPSRKATVMVAYLPGGNQSQATLELIGAVYNGSVTYLTMNFEYIALGYGMF